MLRAVINPVLWLPLPHPPLNMEMWLRVRMRPVNVESNLFITSHNDIITIFIRDNSLSRTTQIILY